MPYQLFEPELETFEEFISKNLGQYGNEKYEPKALKGLVNPEFDNILYCQSGKKNVKGYEIEIKHKNNNIYEFITKVIPKKIVGEIK